MTLCLYDRMSCTVEDETTLSCTVEDETTLSRTVEDETTVSCTVEDERRVVAVCMRLSTVAQTTRVFVCVNLLVVDETHVVSV
jgi:hypothetical protein